MQGGNGTTVTVVGIGGGLTTILMWVLGFFAPAFMAAAPSGVEAAVTTVLVGAICYFLPFEGKGSASSQAPPGP